MTECKRSCLSSYLTLELVPQIRSGFRYWNPPDGPMGQYLGQQIPNRERLTTFLGFWTTFVNGFFAYMGTELIGVTVGEAQNPRKNIPIAIRRTFWRILIFYIGGVFVIGLIVPRTDPTLFVANTKKTGAAASPFVVATTLVGIKTLNHVINGAILIFVLSAANSDLYIGSRTLYGLAVEGKTPVIFKRVNRMGVPYPALILCTAFSSLVFLNVSSSSQKGEIFRHSQIILGSSTRFIVFGWFVNLATTFGAITWMCIVWTHMLVSSWPLEREICSLKFLPQSIHEGSQGSGLFPRGPTLQGTVPTMGFILRPCYHRHHHLFQGL